MERFTKAWQWMVLNIIAMALTAAGAEIASAYSAPGSDPSGLLNFASVALHFGGFYLFVSTMMIAYRHRANLRR